MTQKEMRELDAFCAEHVIGLQRVSGVKLHDGSIDPGEWYSKCGVPIMRTCDYQPTTCPGQGMGIQEKCAEQAGQLTIYFKAGDFCIGQPETDADWSPTITLAACRFARKIFDNQK